MKIGKYEISGINILEKEDDCKCYICGKQTQLLHLWSETKDKYYHAHLCAKCIKWK